MEAWRSELVREEHASELIVNKFAPKHKEKATPLVEREWLF